jgi:ribosomal protein S18 acetylase RimI-like enzyme
MIRKTIDSDASAILKIVEESGQFDADSLDHVEGTLKQYLAGGTDELWFTADDGEPVGVGYCAPEPIAPGVWNLLMLWTRSDRHGKGHGGQLVKHVEETLSANSARLLIVETSSLPAFEAARKFYSKCGFIREATIKNYFAMGDDKLVYTKPIVSKI